MEKDFCGFPIENIEGIYYIHCEFYRDARDCQSLWNQDNDFRKIAFAQFPELKMDDKGIPFRGFSTGFYIHLSIRY